MILFINACVRKDSRTRRLANRLLKKLNDQGTGREPVEEVKLFKAVGLDIVGADVEGILQAAEESL